MRYINQGARGDDTAQPPFAAESGADYSSGSRASLNHYCGTEGGSGNAGEEFLARFKNS